ncbi:MAG: 3-deoxy-manno-octulosonate cytidylyltransferase [Thalassobaculales bacterium]
MCYIVRPRFAKGPAPVTPILIIPARMGSQRLPGKPLADIAGSPMIVHVWRRAVAAAIGPVVVAAAEAEIAAAVEAAGGRAVLTPPELPSGSDRVHAALALADPGGAHDVVVNIQGDFPTLDPADIRAVLEPLADPAVDIGTLCAPLGRPEERDLANVVKPAVVFAPGARVARVPYFSRLPVPSGDGPVYHHIGFYAYRRAALDRFVSLPPSPLELREKLEQLRAVEAGMVIAARLIDSVPIGVDTMEELERARAALAAGMDR